MARKKKSPMPFDTSDWLCNPILKALPLDIKGLWIDMLCYMWDSAERGVMVKPNSEIYTKREIQHLVGKDASGSFEWLDRLIDCGLCGVRKDGAVYCRRMVRDEDIRNKRREAGKKGGNVTKSKVFSNITQSRKRAGGTKPQNKAANAHDPQMLLFPDELPSPLSPDQQDKIEKAKKYKYAEFVTLTKDEYAKLCAEYSEETAKRMIQILDNYKGSKGKKYKSDYRAILSWVVDRYNEEFTKYGTKRKASDNGTGSANHKELSGATLSFVKGSSGNGDTQIPPDYSERF